MSTRSRTFWRRTAHYNNLILFVHKRERKKMLNETLFEPFFDKSFVLNNIEQISKYVLALKNLIIINFP